MDDITVVNRMLGHFFAVGLKLHLLRIKNATADKLISDRRQPFDMTFNLNCDPEAADKDFLTEVQKSVIRTQEAFRRCKPISKQGPKTWLLYVAKLEWIDVHFLPFHAAGYRSIDSMIAQREDFDLKADALGKWVE